MLWTHRSGLIMRKARRIPKALIGCMPTIDAYLSISKWMPGEFVQVKFMIKDFKKLEENCDADDL
jgi:hypothetical protein